ncbi:unnamed protein product [Coregonus sp. 'balchen']|nr:unnamed protein product [Coregonus sp. 'balchen']
MSGPKQTLTGTQSAEPSDNLQPTQWTLSLDLAEPTNTMLPVNGSDMEEPRVLRMSRPCKDEDADYCLNGQCMYPLDSDTPACTCDSSYGGPRCGLLVHQATLCKSATIEEV